MLVAHVDALFITKLSSTYFRMHTWLMARRSFKYPKTVARAALLAGEYGITLPEEE